MAGRNQIRRWQLVADMSVVVLLTLLNPFVTPHKLTPCIPDKVEVRVYRHAAIDSVVFNGQFKELEYYLRTHQVTDEGYNQIAQYNSALVRSSRKDSLPTRTETVRIAAKDRLLPAVKTAGGYWKAGRFHSAPAPSFHHRRQTPSCRNRVCRRASGRSCPLALPWKAPTRCRETGRP